MCTLSKVNNIDVWRISQANAGVIISERIDNVPDDNTILIVIAIIKLKFRLYGAEGSRLSTNGASSGKGITVRN